MHILAVKFKLPQFHYHFITITATTTTLQFYEVILHTFTIPFMYYRKEGKAICL